MFETIALAALVPLGVWGATCIVITGQERVRMIETFGKFSKTAEAGLSFKWPAPFQFASQPLSLQQLQLSETVKVKSSDNAFVEVPIRLQYRVDPRRVKDAYYKLSNPEAQIRSYIVNQVRSTASGMSFDELFQSKDTFENAVEETLKDKMTEFGFIIANILVDDPQPSEELREAFDRVIASKRLLEASKNEAEAERVIAVAKAEAEGESLEIKGKAYASFRQTIAEGNAEALSAFVKDTGLSARDALEFFKNINEMEAVRDASSYGGRVVFVAGSAKKDENAALLGMLAGNDGEAGPAANTPPAKKTKSADGEAAESVAA